jgi:putative chitinase
MAEFNPLVRDVQLRLKEKGFDVAADGVIGPSTLNAVLKALGGPPERHKAALAHPDAFFASLHASGLFDALAQPQVDGLNTCLAACGDAGWPIAWTAYALATAHHETNHTFEPVREAYWTSEGWRKANLRYYPWYGRGYVQCTWEANYRRADAELGLGGKLLADADLMLKPEIAAPTMVKGMEEGWFSSHKLADTLPEDKPATLEQFTASRPIINGHDKAELIAGYADKFQAALQKGGWA